MAGKQEQANFGLDPLANLRLAAERMREVRGSDLSGLAIAGAEYEIASEPVNQEFINGLFQALPFDISVTEKGYKDYLMSLTGWVHIANAQDVAPVKALLLGVHSYEYQCLLGTGSGLVIGEKPSGKRETELLIAGKFAKGYRLGGNNMNSLSNYLKVNVNTKQWDASRLARMAKLSANDTTDQLIAAYDSTTGSYAFRPSLQEYPDSPFLSLITGSPDRKSFPGSLRATWRQTVHLRTGDFIDFNIMNNLEVVASIFGIDEQFAELRARREAALPEDAEGKFFGLPGNRQALEKAAGQMEQA